MILVPHGLRLMDFARGSATKFGLCNCGAHPQLHQHQMSPVDMAVKLPVLEGAMTLISGWAAVELKWHLARHFWSLTSQNHHGHHGISMASVGRNAFTFQFQDLKFKLRIQVAGPKPYMIQAGLRLLYVYLVMYFQFRNLMLNHQTNQHRPNPHWPRSMVQIQVSFHCGDSVCRTVASPLRRFACHLQLMPLAEYRISYTSAWQEIDKRKDKEISASAFTCILLDWFWLWKCVFVLGALCRKLLQDAKNITDQAAECEARW